MLCRHAQLVGPYGEDCRASSFDLSSKTNLACLLPTISEIAFSQGLDNGLFIILISVKLT